MTSKKICVFCSSSNNIESIYFDLARKTGEKCIENNFGLIFGGGKQGLMGEVAKTVKEKRGYVMGIVPRKLQETNIIFDESDDLIITESMFDRKSMMIRQADGFICLPGGFGTLDEMLEVITLKQLAYIDKPIAIVNIEGFFNSILAQFDFFFKKRFVSEKHRKLYFASSNIDKIFDYIKTSI